MIISVSRIFVAGYNRHLIVTHSGNWILKNGMWDGMGVWEADAIWQSV